MSTNVHLNTTQSFLTTNSGASQQQLLSEAQQLAQRVQQVQQAVRESEEDLTPAPDLIAPDILARAEEAMSEKNYPFALKVFTRAIKEMGWIPPHMIRLLFPQNPHRLSCLHLKRGASHFGMGQLDEAIADFSRVIETCSGTPLYIVLALLSRGMAYTYQQNTDAAFRDYERIAEMNDLPPDLRAAMHINRGSTFVFLEDWAAAINEYTAAIELDPSNNTCAKAYTLRGLAKEWIDPWESALADYACALALNPPDAALLARTLLCHAYASEKLGNTAAAIQSAERVNFAKVKEDALLYWLPILNHKIHAVRALLSTSGHVNS